MGILAFIILAIFIAAAGGMIFFIIQQKRKTKLIEKTIAETGDNPSAVTSIESTYEQLPFEDISDSMIDLGNHQYRMVLECGSINLNLKTDEEKDVVEYSFQDLLSSMDFPFQIYIQTREIDNRQIVENMRKDAEKMIRHYPALEPYAINHLNELSNLNNTIGNSKHKKKYIIIAFNEGQKLHDMSDEDIKDYAFGELYNRCNVVSSQLLDVGIHSEILNSSKIAEMVFRAYNKEDDGALEILLSGKGFEMIVDSEKHVNELSPEAKLDLIIIQFFKKLETEIINNSNTPKAFKDAANQSIEALEKIRDYTGGYFKENVKEIDEAALEEELFEID
ncbi:hypothetical protein MKA27_19530 [[Clostridium] innocuum]|uniref:hypothetical protein n=1 Tax=Clostridium innocuum TaxID=1522 RepID=UPI000D6AD043|nr:hypothetical protein [[Clostridium] innocuum]MCR0315629.1 hypothetical protein [[Clostridium] innocuum]MCR0371655.1 hypothetical protein [[Clostridium] innocuum]MCR0375982.1 hypothetical protein [[Clostridium] innocuum]MCR0561786.1 hypothetical protein [[Clostridium] innocuum]MCR0604263.1 hypothetical protein [[Clostridium] innocuum]